MMTGGVMDIQDQADDLLNAKRELYEELGL
jgi:8-oxo-dGTP pyrophosphatase MutT (NUDIX family)